MLIRGNKSRTIPTYIAMCVCYALPVLMPTILTILTEQPSVVALGDLGGGHDIIITLIDVRERGILIEFRERA